MIGRQEQRAHALMHKWIKPTHCAQTHKVENALPQDKVKSAYDASDSSDRHLCLVPVAGLKSESIPSHHSLDGMLVHHSVIHLPPPPPSSPVLRSREPICTPGWREALWERNTMSPAKAQTALTTRPPRPPQTQSYNYAQEVVFACGVYVCLDGGVAVKTIRPR